LSHSEDNVRFIKSLKQLQSKLDNPSINSIMKKKLDSFIQMIIS